MQTQFLVWKWPLGNAFLCFIDAQSFWHVMSETVVLPFLFTLIKKRTFTFIYTWSVQQVLTGHKLWGRDRWWGLEPPQIEHARPRAKYKLELTLGWVCWLWNAGHVFFVNSNSPNSKISTKSKICETAQWGLFFPPSEVGQPKLCCLHAFDSTQTHLHVACV